MSFTYDLNGFLTSHGIVSRGFAAALDFEADFGMLQYNRGELANRRLAYCIKLDCARYDDPGLDMASRGLRVLCMAM